MGNGHNGSRATPDRVADTTKSDYKQIVDKSHSVFTVFTGAILSFYVSGIFSYNTDIWQFWKTWHFWVVPAVIALLLRYIVGSAGHLNATYVESSGSLGWLFFDILWLIATGFLAMLITKATSDIDTFLLSTLPFLGAGFLWSLSTYRRGTKEWDMGRRWLTIDGLQFLGTLGLYFLLPLPDIGKAMVVAVVYLFALYWDFNQLLKWSTSEP